MRLIPRQSLWALILFILIGASTMAQAAEPTTTPRDIKVEATAQAGGAVDKGDPRVVSSLLVNIDDAIHAGVLMQMDPHWHVYWRNSGEAGLPTQITWRAQVDGAWKDLGQTISWPAPQTFTESGGTITTYGYADEVLHTLMLPKTIKAPVTIEAKVNFLTCAKICIPGDVVLRRTIDATHKNAHGDIFEHWGKRIPEPASSRGWKVATQPTITYPGDQPLLALTLTCEDAAKCGGAVLASGGTNALVPDAKNQITWKPVRLTPNAKGDGWTIELKGKTSADAKVGKGLFEGVLNLKDKHNEPIPVVLNAPVDIQATAPKATTPNTAVSATTPSPEGPKPPPISLLYAMLLAFIGGLLLNGMPCVFPVLTLKLSALAEMATASRKTMTTQALAYTAGIVVSMLALASVIIALRVAGTQVGWGFQFQNPWYLTAQCALLVLFAVNLFGGFEVLLPVNINVGAMNVSEDGVGRSFFEGLLCVLLATPCTAPLMGTAIGFALSSSTAVILAIFVTLGLGLASPFLLLVAVPGWRKWIPKPGNWLNRLKQFMGFSLIGTSAWLIWVVGSSYGVDGMFRLMMFLVVLSISGWAFGVVQFDAGWKKRLVVTGAILAILGAGWGLLRFDDAKTAGQQVEAKDGWVAFDEAKIKAAQQNGQPVFVDFTADWCISCKVNERTVLASDDVQKAVKSNNILMMKADWTRRDERIRLILSKYGKAGVPMYLVYSPHRQAPEVLPEVLTPSLVVKALARAAKTP